MPTHFTIKQHRLKRQTVWLIVAYLLSYATIVYLTYSLMQALTHLAADGTERPPVMVFYLLTCPFNTGIPGNLSALANIAGVIAVILAGSSAAAYWNLRHGGPALAKMIGAERIVPKTAGKFDRRLHNIVEEIAIASETRVPRVFVLRQEKGINSFSAGWNPDDAILCVTQGLIDQLSRDEQQAVVAHEFSHILNGDMRLNMRLIGLLVGSHILILISWGTISTIIGAFLYPPLFAYAYIFVEEIISPGLMAPANIFSFITLFFGLSTICFFNLILNIVLKLAIARRRVFLADACAVQWTRHPVALISALQKIGDNIYGSHILHSRSGSVAHMTFASVFRGRSISQWFDTHPSVKRRIRAIESRRELWPEEPKREPRPELTQDPMERAARDWSSDGTTRDIPLDLATVADLLLAIPDDIRQLAADVETVMPLVFALLLDAGEEIRNKQLAMIERIIDSPTRERTQVIVAKTDPLAARLRPPLAEITFPTLRDLSPEQYAAFRETVAALIRADGKIDLFEYTFNARLLNDLDRHFRRVPEARVMYHSTQAVLEPFTVLLSAVAYAGNRGDGQLLPSYNEGIHIFGHRKPILSSKECTMQAVDAALKKLAEASPAVKRRIIRALVACVMADDFVTPREREILRAIAAMLHVSLPTMA